MKLILLHKDLQHELEAYLEAQLEAYLEAYLEAQLEAYLEAKYGSPFCHSFLVLSPISRSCWYTYYTVVRTQGISIRNTCIKLSLISRSCWYTVNSTVTQVIEFLSSIQFQKENYRGLRFNETGYRVT